MPQENLQKEKNHVVRAEICLDCGRSGNVGWRGETANTSKFPRRMNEQLMKVLLSRSKSRKKEKKKEKRKKPLWVMVSTPLLPLYAPILKHEVLLLSLLYFMSSYFAVSSVFSGLRLCQQKEKKRKETELFFLEFGLFRWAKVNLSYFLSLPIARLI